VQHRWQLGQTAGQALGFRHHFPLHVLQGGTAQGQAALQGALHAHVEPGLDGAGQELHRNAVHHHAGHQGHEADDEEEAGGELGAEYAGADAPHQDIGLVADEDDEADGGDGGGAQQERKVFREEGGVVRRRHQQRDQGGAQQQTGGDQVDHAGPEFSI
jgi:hypothetical protein